jgi:hypothetical protein
MGHVEEHPEHTDDGELNMTFVHCFGSNIGTCVLQGSDAYFYLSVQGSVVYKCAAMDDWIEPEVAKTSVVLYCEIMSEIHCKYIILIVGVFVCIHM